METVAIIHRPKVPGKPEDYTAEDVKVVKEMIEEAVDLSVGGIDKVIMPGDKVLIKPNVVFPAPPSAHATTDPRVVEALVSLIKERIKPVRVVVGENSCLNFSTREAMQISGVEAAARRGGADDVIYFDEYTFVDVKVPLPGAKAWVDVNPRISKAIFDADFVISLPKMKTHHAAVASLSMKNWQGILESGPTQQQGMHREDLHQKIAELQKVAPANLAIVDAIIAMHGSGVWMGGPIEMNLIIAGKDPVAVDAVSSSVMGIHPMEVGYIRIANVEKIGVGDLSQIEVKGKKIEEVRKYFVRAIYSPVGFAPNVEVYMAGACLGCIQTIRGALDTMESSKIPYEKAGRLIFVSGYNTAVPDLLDPDTIITRGRPTIWLVGDCLPQKIRDKYKGKEGVIDCPGCPPIHVYLDAPLIDVPRVIKEREKK